MQGSLRCIDEPSGATQVTSSSHSFPERSNVTRLPLAIQSNALSPPQRVTSQYLVLLLAKGCKRITVVAAALLLPARISAAAAASSKERASPTSSSPVASLLLSSLLVSSLLFSSRLLSSRLLSSRRSWPFLLAPPPSSPTPTPVASRPRACAAAGARRLLTCEGYLPQESLPRGRTPNGHLQGPRGQPTADQDVTHGIYESHRTCFLCSPVSHRNISAISTINEDYIRERTEYCPWDDGAEGDPIPRVEREEMKTHYDSMKP